MLGHSHRISKLNTQGLMRCQNLTKAIQSVMLVANIVKQFARFAFWVLLRQAVESRE